jgi:hypothetical protein
LGAAFPFPGCLLLSNIDGVLAVVDAVALGVPGLSPIQGKQLNYKPGILLIYYYIIVLH